MSPTWLRYPVALFLGIFRARVGRFATGLTGWLLVVMPFTGCVSGGGAGFRPARPPPAETSATPVEREEGSALLLLMADRRTFDPFSVGRILEARGESAEKLALTLGRVGDARAVPVLEELLGSSKPETARAAAFALGWLGRNDALLSLLAATRSSDRQTGGRAVEALARIEIPLARVLAAMEELPTDEFWFRLLPSLFRFSSEDLLPVARAALSATAAAPPELHRWAIYAVARNGVVDGADLLRRRLEPGAESDPWVRGWAARGLGGVGGANDLERLLALLEDPSPGPVIHALRAAPAILAREAAADPADPVAPAAPAAPAASAASAASDHWVPRLLDLLIDPRPGVRLTAIEAASAWLPEERLANRLALAASGEAGAPRERALALLALARASDSRASSLVHQAASDSSPSLRAAAAEAAGHLGLNSVLLRLHRDASPRVRQTVVAAILETDRPAQLGLAERRSEARRALIDPDPAVRAGALQWFALNPMAPAEELVLAIDEFGVKHLADLRIEGISALLARARAESLERGSIVETLEALSIDREYTVRRAANDALRELGRPTAPAEPVETGRNLEDYRTVDKRIAASGEVEIRTSHGVVRLELDCEAAPLTCSSFLQLVNQKFYDGSVLHRVVPDFVVQGGDPRGDGWGGPGYSLRDEPNLLRYERGVVGMARSGPDTAGSQFFITLSRQPHLDGAYTAFGRVVAGLEVLDQLIEGDELEAVVEIGHTP